MRSSQADPQPMATAAPAPTTNFTPAFSGSRSDPDTAAPSASWKITREAASLKSPSLCRVMRTRRGMGTELATDSTATGSGGATIAPSATAAARVMPGSRSIAVEATAATVTTTNPSASHRRARHFARITCQEERCAAE